jgi:hypothetical protein
MKRYIFSLIAVFMALCNIDAQDRLYPAHDSSSPVLEEYYSRRDSLLWNGYENKDYLFLVNPSFSAEWACYYDLADSVLVLRVADKNIWYSAYGKKGRKLKTPAKVKVKEYRCPVSKEAMDKCNKLFFSAVMSSSYLAVPMGVDGITYKIYWGSFIAECWSPLDDSNCYKLTEIIDSLTEAIKMKDTERIDNLIPAMESLRVRFESLYPEDLKKNNQWIDFLDYNGF